LGKSRSGAGTCSQSKDGNVPKKEQEKREKKVSHHLLGCRVDGREKELERVNQKRLSRSSAQERSIGCWVEVKKSGQNLTRFEQNKKKGGSEGWQKWKLLENKTNQKTQQLNREKQRKARKKKEARPRNKGELRGKNPT